MNDYLIVVFRIFTIIPLLMVTALVVMGRRPIAELPVFDFLEQNGRPSAMKKTPHSPVTPSDLNLKTEARRPSTTPVMEGRIETGNLGRVGLTAEGLVNLIEQRGLALGDVFYASMAPGRDLFVVEYKS